MGADRTRADRAARCCADPGHGRDGSSMSIIGFTYPSGAIDNRGEEELRTHRS
jgi:hypothetical protein